MQPSLNKLMKIFTLESERQFDNGAVMGGLEKMMPGWAAEARAEDVNEPLINAVISQLRNYDDLEPEYRAEALKNVWGRIERETGTEPGKGKASQHASTEFFQIKLRPVAQRPATGPARKSKPKAKPKVEIKKKPPKQKPKR